jgi:hypothetical protein
MSERGKIDPPYVKYEAPGRLATAGAGRRPPGNGSGDDGGAGMKFVTIVDAYAGYGFFKDRVDDYLNQFRDIRFISAEEMAAKIGLPVERYRLILDRKAYPERPEAEVFAEFLGGNVENYLEGIPPEEVKSPSEKKAARPNATIHPFPR